MSDSQTLTALVTGATSGLGFEAAAQLAEKGYTRVTITGRTAQKAAAAKEQLQERTGKDVFETLVLDNDQLESIEKAVVALPANEKISLLILNAGIAPPSKPATTADGLNSVISSSLVGHHLLTVRLLENNLLSDGARIVISGSEAARGDVFSFTPLDVDAFAAEHFGGDREASIETYIRMRPPAEYKGNDVYATTKQFVAWWAAELAKKLPRGMTVNAVSPGSTPDTNAIRNAPFFLRYLMVPMFKLMPGMSHSVADGAARYLEVAEYGDEATGRFYASPPKKMIGALTHIELDHLDNPAAQAAMWNVLAGITGAPEQQREAEAS